MSIESVSACSLHLDWFTEHSSNPPPSHRTPSQSFQQSQPKHHQIPSTTGRRTQKLRLSCNACGSSKVRCGKERPSCERCAGSGFQCIYGLSMKHGKGSQKRRQLEAQAAAVNLEPAIASSEKKTNNEIQRRFYNLSDNAGNYAGPLSQQWPTMDELAAQSFSLHTQPSAATFPNAEDVYQRSIGESSHSASYSIETMDSVGQGQSETYRESLDPTISNFPDINYSQLMDMDLSKQMDSSSCASSSPSNRDAVAPQDQGSSPGLADHDCYVIANSTLAMLHISSQKGPDDYDIRASPTYTSDPISCGPQNTVQRLHEVFRCIKEAMGNVHRLLICTCATDPQMAMLNASIIIRILHWHRLGASIHDSDSIQLPPLVEQSSINPYVDSSYPANYSHRSSYSTPIASVAPEPISIGSFVPDQEDQDTLRHLYLLVNLKKLGRMVEAFAQAEDHAELGPGQIRGTLATWLKTELRQTTNIVGSRVKGSSCERM